MIASQENVLARTLREFFSDHLPRLRGLSPHTIHSYRDSFTLLLRFMTSKRSRPVAKLDLTPPGKPPPLAVRLEEALPFRRVIDDLLSMNREVQKRRSTCESGKANRT